MKKKYIFPIFLIFFALSTLSYANFEITSVTPVKNYQYIETEDITKLKDLGSFHLSVFTIDDSGNGNYTWEEAAEQEWCSGNGTLDNPYIIENITINGEGYARCLSIKNSKAHFIIRNSFFYNAGISPTFPFYNPSSLSSEIDIRSSIANDTIIIDPSDLDPFRGSGIWLSNVTNGKLINNDCSFNYVIGIYPPAALPWGATGICLQKSKNNTLYGNRINNNNIGIMLSNSNDNLILRNNVSYNYDGIYLNGENHNNTISQNVVDNNEGYGINIFLLMLYYNNEPMFDFPYQNEILGNEISHNLIGISLVNCYNATLSKNVVKNNIHEGIRLYASCYNNISGNNVFNNTYGVRLDNKSDNNTITENLVIDNEFFIVVEEGCDGNIIENNYNYIIPAGRYETETFHKKNLLVNLSISVDNITKMFFMSFDDNPIEKQLNDELFFIDLYVNDTKNLDDSNGKPINLTLKYDFNRYRNISAWWFNNSANNGEGDWEKISFTNIDDGIIFISVNQTAIFALTGFDIGIIIPIDIDKSSDKDQNNDSIIIFQISFITIALLVFIISIAVNYIYPNSRSERFTKLVKKKKNKELNVIFTPVHSARKILEEMIDKSSILQTFDEIQLLEEMNIKEFEDFELVQLSKNFLKKVDKTDLKGDDKKDFLEEMIALPIELRNHIVDNILKRLKQENSLEKVPIGIF